MTPKTCVKSQGLIFIFLALLIIFAGCSGCINKIRDATQGTEMTTPMITPGTTESPVTPTYVPQVTHPEVTETVHQVTPMKSDAVVEVTPFTTPDPYPILHGARINSTPEYSFLDRTPEFTKTYTLGGNAVGLLVNVVQGPLYVVYTINPKYDCLKDPDSCRGTVLVPVNRPYMTITVRDNQTQEIVAQSGYGREYSSDTGNYQFTFSGTSPDSSDTGASVTYPGPRYVAIYKEGQFQITMEGNYLDVNLEIITGASPNPQDMIDEPASSAPVPTPEYVEE
jgi:hypothetical protein